jgi:hypothetical protein
LLQRGGTQLSYAVSAIPELQFAAVAGRNLDGLVSVNPCRLTGESEPEAAATPEQNAARR